MGTSSLEVVRGRDVFSFGELSLNPDGFHDDAGLTIRTAFESKKVYGNIDLLKSG